MIHDARQKEGTDDPHGKNIKHTSTHHTDSMFSYRTGINPFFLRFEREKPQQEEDQQAISQSLVLR